MSLNYRKRITLGKHLTLNVSKKGLSSTIKLGPFSVNPKNKKMSVNLPGGWYYTKSFKKKKK